VAPVVLLCQNSGGKSQMWKMWVCN
jgi:hypothetical protein